MACGWRTNGFWLVGWWWWIVGQITINRDEVVELWRRCTDDEHVNYWQKIEDTNKAHKCGNRESPQSSNTRDLTQWRHKHWEYSNFQVTETRSTLPLFVIWWTGIFILQLIWWFTINIVAIVTQLLWDHEGRSIGGVLFVFGVVVGGCSVERTLTVVNWMMVGGDSVRLRANEKETTNKKVNLN